MNLCTLQMDAKTPQPDDVRAMQSYYGRDKPQVKPQVENIVINSHYLKDVMSTVESVIEIAALRASAQYAAPVVKKK
jgi:hypothetical protein